MRVSQLTSKTISALRLPLIIGVVFIHNSSAELPGMDISEAINDVTCWGGKLHNKVGFWDIGGLCSADIFLLFALYFGSVFLSVIVCLLIYKLMQLVCPRMLQFVTGGHSSK